MSDKVFTKCMASLSYGHALYKMVSAAKLKPGACGYFDENSDWVSIVQVTDPAALVDGKWGPLVGRMDVAPDDGKELWFTKTSLHMKEINPKAKVAVNVPGAPVGAGMEAGWKSESKSGAVIMTDGVITHNQATPASTFRHWMDRNGQKILNEYEDTQTEGVWIVTKTWTAKKRAVAVLESIEREIKFGIDVELWGVGQIAPDIKWWTAKKSQDWAVHENDNGIVLFLEGMVWTPRWISKELYEVKKSKQSEWMGADDSIEPILIELEPTKKNKETVFMQLEPTAKGKVEGFDEDGNPVRHDDHDSEGE